MKSVHEPTPPAATSYTIIAPPGRPWTEDDLLTWGDDGYQYELVRGELRQMNAASFTHGEYEIRLLIALAKYLENHPNLGKIRPGDTGFKLQTNPPTVRVPDVSFVATERIPTGDIPAFLPLAPDLVVEIISPSERAGEIAEKVDDYLTAGTRLLWLVYPRRQEVEEHRPDAPLHTYRSGDDLDGREVLPGFRYPLRDLFA